MATFRCGGGWLASNLVKYQGQTMLSSDWLVKKSVLSRKRAFVAPNGRLYE
ncbi:hypothetical protein VTO73DRAFT_2620 [Trametes versicolor]